MSMKIFSKLIKSCFVSEYDYKQDIILVNVFVTSKLEILGCIILYSNYCAEMAAGLHV